MAGLKLFTFSLNERRIEPTETATFSLQGRNTYEELGITNIKISATFTPAGTITVINTSGDLGSRVINPFGECKFLITIQTTNTLPADYKMDIKFDYDVVVPDDLQKFSLESRTITIVPD